MATVVNKNGQAKEFKAKALEKLEANASVLAEQQNVVESNEQLQSKWATDSGLMDRLDAHFISLKKITWADMPTMVVITSKNIPTNIDVIATQGKAEFDDNGKQNKADINIVAINNSVQNEGDKLTTEQFKANESITSYVGKLSKSTKGYINEVIDICRDFAQLCACADAQVSRNKEKLYNRFAKKAGLESTK